MRGRGRTLLPGMLVALVLTLVPALAPVAARAQGAANLIADRIEIEADGTRLVASGNVEVFYDDTRLSAARITYDATSDRLRIEGPVFIAGPDGSIFTAEAARIDPTLQSGVLRSARLVLDRQLQLAANQIDRVEGRYTQLHGVAVTSCTVCATGEAPLWELRARRIVHDQEARQLWSDDAHLRIAGVPVFWLPRLRLPDPTLERATGFLSPAIRSNSNLGVGLRLPYFIRLGDARDLTLTPWLSASTSTLEARYRQAYLRGALQIDAAISRDDQEDDLRGYLFARGAFAAGRDWTLRFDLETASDDAYLLDYGYTDIDRLTSELTADRVRDRDLVQLSFAQYSTLRDGETDSTLPPLLADAHWERRLTPPGLGGTLTLGADLQAHYRYSDTALDGAGRDVTRAGLSADWRRQALFGPGLVVEAQLAFALDHYAVDQDDTIGDATRASWAAATTLRYPLIRRGAQAVHVVEPVVMLAWSDTTDTAVRNEDSTSAEFDEANLLALSRFPGEDAVETGRRAAIGLAWTRRGDDGWQSRLSFGRILRDTAQPGYSAASGLDGRVSDWLLAWQVTAPRGLGVDGRLVVDDGLDVVKSEARAFWRSDRVDLNAGYLFLQADPLEGRADDVSEWTFDTIYRIDEVWSVGLDARVDAAQSEPIEAGLGIGWRNECVAVDLSVSRRFTSSINVEPSTEFGLSVELLGFSAGRAGAGASARCAD